MKLDLSSVLGSSALKINNVNYLVWKWNIWHIFDGWSFWHILQFLNSVCVDHLCLQVPKKAVQPSTMVNPTTQKAFEE